VPGVRQVVVVLEWIQASGAGIYAGRGERGSRAETSLRDTHELELNVLCGSDATARGSARIGQRTLAAMRYRELFSTTIRWVHGSSALSAIAAREIDDE